MSLNIPNPPLTHQELQYHKIKSIDTDIIGKTIDTHSLLDIDDFEELVSKFFGSLQSALDATAPLKTGGDPVSSQILAQQWYHPAEADCQKQGVCF